MKPSFRSSTLIYDAMKKEIAALKQEIVHLKFQIMRKDDMIQNRNKEIYNLIKDDIIDLTTPPRSPIRPSKRKLSKAMDDLMQDYFNSFDSDEETKMEEVYYNDSPKTLKKHKNSIDS